MHSQKYSNSLIKKKKKKVFPRTQLLQHQVYHKYHETHKTLELSVHSQAHHHLLLISELLALFQYDHDSYLMVEPGDRLIWSLANCYAVYYAPQNIICPAKKITLEVESIFKFISSFILFFCIPLCKIFYVNFILKNGF